MSAATSDTCLAGLEPAGLRKALQALSPGQVVCHSDRRLSISASRVRGFLGHEPFVAVSGAEKADEQVKGFTDALYWQLSQAPTSRPQYFIGRSEATVRVLQALASLNDLLPEKHRVAVHVDGDRATLRLPDFAGEKPHWLKLLRARDELLHKGPPPLAVELKKRVDHADFRWHLSVRAPSWSGRLGGLRVCEVELDGSRGRVAVGKAGSKHTAARAFRELAPGPFDFTEDTLDTAAAVVRGLAQRGAGLGDPEHRLEDQILRNQIELVSPETGERLKAALDVSQFPAVWWQDDRANRYTDLLLREGDTPWLVELKVATQGQGKYYRHAIGQAALYRAFIRGARGLSPWFEEHSLNAERCRAAIAFPALQGSRAKELSSDLRKLAAAFDVIVFELPPETANAGP